MRDRRRCEEDRSRRRRPVDEDRRSCRDPYNTWEKEEEGPDYWLFSEEQRRADSGNRRRSGVDRRRERERTSSRRRSYDTWDDSDYPDYSDSYDYSDYPDDTEEWEEERRERRTKHDRRLEEKRRSKGRKKNSSRKRLARKKRRRKRIILFVLLLLAFVVGLLLYCLSKAKLLNYQALDKDQLETAADTGCTNIALFGLDSREGELDQGVRSDCMIVASINKKTRKIKLVSVYRDTLTQQEDGSYSKANSAFSYGGAQEAVALLNRNLDLDITQYVAVNFNAMISIIDELGGVEIDVQEEEIPYINAYAVEIIKVTGVDSVGVESAGTQVLNGVQATAYSRIRYTAGDDFKRTERQRVVLQQIINKAKKAGPITLNRLINKAFPQISTNLTSGDLFKLGLQALWCKMSDNTGFPFDVTTSENVQGLSGSYVIPVGMAQNVQQLHQYLFEDSEYQPSEKVQQISEDISWLSGVYP